MKCYLLLVAFAACNAGPGAAAEPDWLSEATDAVQRSPLDVDVQFVNGDLASVDRRGTRAAPSVRMATVLVEDPEASDLGEPAKSTDAQADFDFAPKLASLYSGSVPIDCGDPCIDCGDPCSQGGSIGCGAPVAGLACLDSVGNCCLGGNQPWPCLPGARPVGFWTDAFRIGWWGVGTDGSKNKTGEFQDLSSSPFWDVDAISSDGVRTWSFVLSGLDNEANDARARYYGPSGSGRVDFQRFLRRWDHDPLTGFDVNNPVPPGPNDNVISQDLNVGEDYAIRVDELDTRFQGRISDSLKWRLNVWAQRKFGERQSNATAHCFNINAPNPPGANGNVCHVLSQRQTIDWITVEIQPVVEVRFDNVALEYSRTMRGFAQDDQSITRQYTRFNFSPASGELGPDFAYAVVPESFTQVDRLKATAILTEDNQLYGNAYIGDTKNDFRDTHRSFSGYDLRLINSSIDDLKVTAYSSLYDEHNDFPPFFFNAPPLAPANNYDETSLRHPVDYLRTRAGLRGSWQPFGDRGPRRTNFGLWEGTSLVSGYEYYFLARDFATYDTALGPFTQLDTKTHQIEFGPSTRWSPSMDTYARYKVQFIDNPLIGVREFSGGFNTNQPEQVHLTEIGWTWLPAANFMTTAQLTLINSWHQSEFANFSEDSYPIVLTAWYAPTPRLSLTGGYAHFSNWIDQDITLGFTTPNIPVPPVRTETTRWNYAGENDLISFSANYAWRPDVQLVGGVEWNRGFNGFTVPPSPAGADWSLLPFLSDVIVETTRLTAGVDWQPFAATDVYLRYIVFDYDDISSGLYTGTAHMALAGATRTW
jgi:hypothetical protein